MPSLYPYQEKGADWLAAGQRVLYLADEMRVGKTPQAAVAAGRVGAKHVLVVCPGLVRKNWITEFRDFCPDPGFAANARVIYTSDDVEAVDGSTRLVIVSYDLITTRPQVQSKLVAWAMVASLDVLILDEAHYLKSREARRTQAILGKTLNGVGAVAGLADRVWFVSGTPTPNHAGELFPFVRAAGRWPQSKSEFEDRFCVGYHDGYEYKITGSKRQAELAALLAPVMLRRKRTEVADVNLHISKIGIEPREIDPTSPMLAYLARQEPKYAKIIRAQLAEGSLDRLPVSSVSTVRRLIGMAKVAGMCEIIKDTLDSGVRKVVVFGLHRDPLRYLRASLRGEYKPILIFGGTNPKDRERLVDAFQTNPGRRVFLANMTAAGLGIDLSAADLVYIFETSWSVAENEQAISRIINLRQSRLKEAVFVGLSGTIDDAVARIYERKAQSMAGIYDPAVTDAEAEQALKDDLANFAMRD